MKTGFFFTSGFRRAAKDSRVELSRFPTCKNLARLRRLRMADQLTACIERFSVIGFCFFFSTTRNVGRPASYENTSNRGNAQGGCLS